MPRNRREEQSLANANGHAMNGTPRGAQQQDSQQDEDQTDENIFLFVPNLIGQSRTTGPTSTRQH